MVNIKKDEINMFINIINTDNTNNINNTINTDIKCNNINLILIKPKI